MYYKDFDTEITTPSGLPQRCCLMENMAAEQTWWAAVIRVNSGYTEKCYQFGESGKLLYYDGIRLTYYFNCNIDLTTDIDL